MDIDDIDENNPASVLALLEASAAYALEWDGKKYGDLVDEHDCGFLLVPRNVMRALGARNAIARWRTTASGDQLWRPTGWVKAWTDSQHDARFVELRLRAKRECGFGTYEVHTHWDGCACRQLALAETEREVERLRAENAQMRALTEALASTDGLYWYDRAGVRTCVYCGTVQHSSAQKTDVPAHFARCLHVKACALLAGESEINV
jgi:hypothetical protein